MYLKNLLTEEAAELRNIFIGKDKKDGIKCKGIYGIVHYFHTEVVEGTGPNRLFKVYNRRN